MSNLTQRILSALFLIPFVLYLIFFSSDSILHYSLCFISFFSAFEFTGICFNKKFFFQRFLVSFLSFLLTYLLPTFFSQPILLISFFPFSFLLLSLFFMFSKEPISVSLNALSFSFFGLFYCGFLLSFIFLISLFDPIEGRTFIFLLLLGTFLGDTGAYSFGRLFGQKKLYPKLSPGKTWAGSFGGFLMTLFSIGLVKFFALPSFSFFELFILSFILSISCQLGDLVESFLKRGFSVKDSGTLIPGHGGILDRIDALLFGAPIVFFFFYLR